MARVSCTTVQLWSSFLVRASFEMRYALEFFSLVTYSKNLKRIYKSRTFMKYLISWSSFDWYSLMTWFVINYESLLALRVEVSIYMERFISVMRTSCSTRLLLVLNSNLCNSLERGYLGLLELFWHHPPFIFEEPSINIIHIERTSSLI